ncbi:hypothetical protein ACHAWF_001037 [Thalassiosira exigua]
MISEQADDVLQKMRGQFRYVKATVKNVKTHLARKGKVLPVRAKTTLFSGYPPELDTSDELGPHDVACYQLLIEILCCLVEIGQMDICVKV